MSPTEIAGVRITPFESVQEAVSHVILTDGTVRPGFAVAINAEKVMRLRRHPSFLQLALQATWCYADGAPIAWLLSRRGIRNNRIPGIDLWLSLMERAADDGIPVFLLGSTESSLQSALEKLESSYGTPVVGFHHGYFRDVDDVIREIAMSGARIVTVGLGSPAQEEFMLRCSRHYPDAFYLGVGGTYDVFAGLIPRAPVWMRVRGLEWLYRLFLQPTRLRRQTALFKFAVLLLRGKL